MHTAICGKCGVEQNFDRPLETFFGPTVRKSVEVTDSNEHGSTVAAGARLSLIGGWSTFAFGSHQGWDVSFDDGRSWEPLEVGQELPPHPMGGVWVRAAAGASGTLRLEAVPSEMLPYARQKAAVASIASSGKGRSNSTWVVAVAPGAGGSTAAQDVSDATQGIVTISGSTDIATDLTIEYSHDGGTTWRDGPVISMAGAAEFTYDLVTAVGRVRLKTSAAATISAQISWR